jgi:hypothetical protein
LVNPVSNSNNEWVSIFNYSNKQIQLNGWKIKDKIKRATPLNGIMGPGQAKRISLLDSSTRLANTGGSISMYTEKDELVCRVGYTEKQGKQKGVVIRF